MRPRALKNDPIVSGGEARARHADAPPCRAGGGGEKGSHRLEDGPGDPLGLLGAQLVPVIDHPVVGRGVRGREHDHQQVFRKIGADCSELLSQAQDGQKKCPCPLEHLGDRSGGLGIFRGTVGQPSNRDEPGLLPTLSQVVVSQLLQRRPVAFRVEGRQVQLPGGQLLPGLPNDGHEQVALVLEVVVQSRLADPGALRDPPERGLLKAGGSELLSGRLEEALALLRLDLLEALQRHELSYSRV